MSKSILVSGNSYIDNIIFTRGFVIDGNNVCDHFSSTLGGVFNFLKVLKSKNHYIYSALSSTQTKLISNKSRSINLNITPTESTCTSTIIADQGNSQRTSFTINGTSRNYIYRNKSYFDYHHISYLDNLPNYTVKVLGEIKKNCGFLTADLCKQDINDKEIMTVIKKIALIDILICSVNEIKALFKTNSVKIALSRLKDHVPRYVIHSPKRVYVRDDKYFDISVPFKKKLQVLGAGDIFCANILKNMSLSMKLENAVKSAIPQTLKVLINET